jgi:hypothetical protein
LKPAHTDSNGVANVSKNGILEHITASVTSTLKPNKRIIMGKNTKHRAVIKISVISVINVLLMSLSLPHKYTDS